MIALWFLLIYSLQPHDHVTYTSMCKLL
ncbi:hypothetical protein KP509_04G031500 [Ceratopteris richardii]|uniref:Uncharacterized protein n=1 Tax=Ceratopteris richardii TaxID=49495 RepID=A0A8T2UYM3_CERRI|nr:hypothetical protein KP509_04G031500 [Ceratopteris richardii]